MPANPTVTIERATPSEKSGSGLLWLIRLGVWGSCLAAIGFGGPLVKLLGGAALVGSIVGDLDGFFRHVLRFASVWFAIFASIAFAADINTLIGGNIAQMSILGVTPGHVVAFLVTMVASTILIAFFNSYFTTRPALSAWNHFLGLCLGMGEGAVMVVVMYWTLGAALPAMQFLSNQVAGQSALNERFGLPVVLRAYAYLQNDPAAKYLNDHNLIKEVPHVQTANRVIAVLDDPEAIELLTQSGKLQDVYSDPAIQAAFEPYLKDQKLREMAQQRDFAGMLASPQLTGLLTDETVLEALNAHVATMQQALVESENPALVAQGEALDPAELERLQQAAETLVGTLRREFEQAKNGADVDPDALAARLESRANQLLDQAGVTLEEVQPQLAQNLRTELEGEFGRVRSQLKSGGEVDSAAIEQAMQKAEADARARAEQLLAEAQARAAAKSDR